MTSLAAALAAGILLGAITTRRSEMTSTSKFGRFRAFAWGTRKRKAASLIAAFLLTTGTALAAWAILSGGHGTSTGTIGGTTVSDALTLTTQAAGVPVAGPGQDGTTWPKVTNANTVPVSIVTATPTITSSPAECASHLTIPDRTPLTEHTPFPASAGTGSGTVLTVHADASLPLACADGTYSVAWVVTTSP